MTKANSLLLLSAVEFFACVVGAAIVGAASATAFQTAIDASSFLPLPEGVERQLLVFWSTAFIALAVAIIAAALIASRASKLYKDGAAGSALRWSVGLAILAPIAGTVVLAATIIFKVSANGG